MKKQKVKRDTFKEAVEGTPDVANGYRAGLQALRSYSGRIEAVNTQLLQGSVDIDTCTTKKYPQANRWDFALAYNSEVFFIEVHSANSSEVSTVIRKLQWLRNWLHQNAPRINGLRATSCFFWIQSKDFQIPKTSPQYIAAKGAGILPIKKLQLN